MCGRFTLRASNPELAKLLGIPDAWPGYRPRYNIAPTQSVAAVREHDGKRELAWLRWGLIPHWAKDAKIGASLTNARADTVATKPSFRTAFKRRRCLIPADGFYEWKTEGKKKRPFFIHRRDDRPFAFAGLWESWTDPAGLPVETCSLITTDANALMQPIHNRMPVILHPADFGDWLVNAERAPELLRQYPAEEMEAVEVDPLVNNWRHESPDCVVPLAKPES